MCPTYAKLMYTYVQLLPDLQDKFRQFWWLKYQAYFSGRLR